MELQVGNSLWYSKISVVIKTKGYTMTIDDVQWKLLSYPLIMTASQDEPMMSII